MRVHSCNALRKFWTLWQCTAQHQHKPAVSISSINTSLQSASAASPQAGTQRQQHHHKLAVSISNLNTGLQSASATSTQACSQHQQPQHKLAAISSINTSLQSASTQACSQHQQHQHKLAVSVTSINTSLRLASAASTQACSQHQQHQHKLAISINKPATSLTQVAGQQNKGALPLGWHPGVLGLGCRSAWHRHMHWRTAPPWRLLHSPAFRSSQRPADQEGPSI